MDNTVFLIYIWIKQEIEATVVDGNGTETGHIIVTTIGGKNGQPKQVNVNKLILLRVPLFNFVSDSSFKTCFRLSVTWPNVL